MGLLDSSLFYLLLTISIILFIATIWFWPKLSPSKLRFIIGRFFLLLLTQTLIVTTIGVTVNNYGDFYGSWSELLGINSASAGTAASPLVFNSAASIKADDLSKADISPGGSAIITRQLAGKKSGEHGQVWIVLPKSVVTQIRGSSQPMSFANYRVIQVLPGFPGTPRIWIDRLDIVRKLEISQLHSGLPPTIAILTESNLLRGYDGECFDTPGGPQIETWLSDDVKEFAKNLLGVQPDKWAIMGLSTGGWCAAMLAVRHPQHFIAAVSVAGYFTPQPNKGLSKKVADQLRITYDLRAIIKATHPKISIFATVAPLDRGSYFQTIHFVEDMKDDIQIRTIALQGAGHNFRAWEPAISPALDWMGNEFMSNPL